MELILSTARRTPRDPPAAQGALSSHTLRYRLGVTIAGLNLPASKVDESSLRE